MTRLGSSSRRNEHLGARDLAAADGPADRAGLGRTLPVQVLGIVRRAVVLQRQELLDGAGQERKLVEKLGGRRDSRAVARVDVRVMCPCPEPWYLAGQPLFVDFDPLESVGNGGAHAVQGVVALDLPGGLGDALRALASGERGDGGGRLLLFARFVAVGLSRGRGRL